MLEDGDGGARQTEAKDERRVIEFVGDDLESML